MPVLEYTHSDGCSITGGYVYRGCALPDLRGTYFYSDLLQLRSHHRASCRRRREQPPGPHGGPRRLPGRTLGSVVSFGEDARGELYVVDLDGELYRIVPALTGGVRYARSASTSSSRARCDGPTSMLAK